MKRPSVHDAAGPTAPQTPTLRAVLLLQSLNEPINTEAGKSIKTSSEKFNEMGTETARKRNSYKDKIGRGTGMGSSIGAGIGTWIDTCINTGISASIVTNI